MGKAELFGIGVALGAGAAISSEYLGHTPQTPETARNATILLDLAVAADALQEHGLTYCLAGGVYYAALLHPNTVYNADERAIVCGSDLAYPLYRENGTRRDLDIRVMNRASPKILKQARLVTQQRIHSAAQARGLAKGAELSLFSFDQPYKNNRFIRPWDYITITTQDERGELWLQHSCGAKAKLPASALETWSVTINGRSYPASDPWEALWRTATRCAFGSKVKDRQKIEALATRLEVADIPRTEICDAYASFASQLATLLAAERVTSLCDQRKLGQAALLASTRGVMSLREKVEATRIATMIQNPDSRFAMIFERLVGAE